MTPARFARLALLLLIAVLLPVRGAWAASMPCGPSEAVSSAAAPAFAAGVHAGDAHADHHDPAAAQAAADTAHAAHLQLCAGVCHATPLAMAPPTVAAPPLAFVLVRAAVAAPLTSFETGGPERPPRRA